MESGVGGWGGDNFDEIFVYLKFNLHVCNIKFIHCIVSSFACSISRLKQHVFGVYKKVQFTVFCFFFQLMSMLARNFVQVLHFGATVWSSLTPLV